MADDTVFRLPKDGWFKSTRTQLQGCVEVRLDGDAILVRDTKYLRNPANDPALNPTISVPVGEWQAFLDAVVDETAPIGPVRIERADDGATLRASDGTALIYNETEWSAFTQGVRDGEFALLPV